MSGFDLLAPVYDQLSYLIFGNSIYRASIQHFNYIKPGDKILIVGGGTGKILTALKHHNIEITYLEKSSAMIRRAKKRGVMYKINFIEGSLDRFPDGQYDVIITAFFLDMFSTIEGKDIVDRLNTRLKKNGLWLFTDFVRTERKWQRILINFMYFFFRLTCNIEANRLPDYSLLFPTQTFKILSSCRYYKGMIHSAVYKSIS